MLCLRQLAGKVQSGQLQQCAAALWSTPGVARAFSQARPSTASQSDTAWRSLQDQGVEVNPCGSKFHPAVQLGLLPVPPEGVVSGGVISTLMECHGNWTAAVSLMDEACLPKPPLTLTYNMNTSYKLPTPPDTPLLLRARTVSIQRPTGLQSKVSIEVALELYRLGPAPQADYSSDIESGDDDNDSKPEDLKPELVVSANAIFKRLGALRAF